MGAIEYSRVTITVNGDGFDPDAITKLLNCEPTKTHRKGDTEKEDGKIKRWRKDFWGLESELPLSQEIEEKISNLLGKVSNDLEIWRDITQKFEVRVFSGIFMESWNEGFTLSSQLLKQLTNRGLQIGFDIYAPVEVSDEEETTTPSVLLARQEKLATTVTNSKVGLSIHSEKLAPDKITKILDCAPTETHLKGEVETTYNTGMIFPTNYWNITSDLPRESEIEAKVEDVLSKVNDDLDIWSDISQRFYSRIFVGIFMEGGNEGFSLSPQLLKKLADRGLEVGFDIYEPV